MAATNTPTLEGTPEQLATLLKQLPRRKRYRLVEIESTETASPLPTPTMLLMQSWLDEDETDDPEELRKAEEELLEFKRNMNAPRKEGGRRILYPEAEIE